MRVQCMRQHEGIRSLTEAGMVAWGSKRSSFNVGIMEWQQAQQYPSV